MEKISAVIITLNEEINIGRCIDSLQSVADEIIVLDSYSSDNTVRIAEAKGAKVYQKEFLGYKEQKNYAIRYALYNYILSLDADETLSESLVQTIQQEKKNLNYHAYSMSRLNIYCGREINHGLWRPDRKLRLFDKRVAYWGGLNPHDKVELKKPLAVKRLNADIIHHAYSSTREHDERNDELTTLSAFSYFESGKKSNWAKIIFHPLWTFINGYFLRMGFIDGYYGWIVAYKTANQTFLKYLKLKRLQNASTRRMVLK